MFAVHAAATVLYHLVGDFDNVSFLVSDKNAGLRLAMVLVAPDRVFAAIP